MTRSLLIWQPTFPKGLGAAAGRPRVAPSTPVLLDVQLLYIPGVSDFDE
jgi:peptidylprolyl isomerase